MPLLSPCPPCPSSEGSTGAWGCPGPAEAVSAQAWSSSRTWVQLLGPETAGQGLPLSRQMWCMNPARAGEVE